VEIKGVLNSGKSGSWWFNTIYATTLQKNSIYKLHNKMAFCGN